MLRAPCLRRGSLHYPARPRSMVPSQAPIPESFPGVKKATTQQPKPAVKRDLSSLKAQGASTQAITSSGTYSASALRRGGLGSRPETNVGTQPRIVFLRPRTARPLVLFRCGAGAQTVLNPAPSAGS